MKIYKLFLLTIIFAAANANDTKQIIDVINNSDEPIDIQHSIPDHTKAHIKAEFKKIKSLKELLYNGILNNSINEIMLAVEAGADVNEEIDGKEPLAWAIEHKRYNAIEVLKKCGAKPKTSLDLYYAILNDSPENIKKILQSGIDVNEVIHDISSRKEPLVWAVLLARHKAVDILLEYGAKTNVHTGITPLSIINGDRHPQATSYDLVQYSLSIGDLKSALSLIKHSPQYKDISKYHHSMSPKPGTLIQLALKFYKQTPELCLEFIQELIDRGYDIHNLDPEINIWSLVISNKNGKDIMDNSLIEFIMKNGANPNQFISAKGSPLEMAIAGNYKKAVELLIEHGAEVNKQIYYCNCKRSKIHTPLCYAMSLSLDEIIKILKKQEVIDVQDELNQIQHVPLKTYYKFTNRTTKMKTYPKR